MEFAYVYLLRCNKKIEEYTFKDDEVSEVKYVLYKDLDISQQLGCDFLFALLYCNNNSFLSFIIQTCAVL